MIFEKKIIQFWKKWANYHVITFRFYGKQALFAGPIVPKY